ncbi:MAG TPA: CoA-binding protein [Symbiobacteriaceae bacterium]|jgi:hypothetical protein
MPSRKVIEEFLKQRRIGVVGVSRNPKEFANMIYRTLREKGYEVYPVNPNATEVEGEPCYPSAKELPERVDGVLVMVPAGKAAAVVQDCQAAGISRVWLHRGAGPGAVSPEAVSLARAAGMAVVDGACPLMFLGSWPHKVHRVFAKLEA